MEEGAGLVTEIAFHYATMHAQDRALERLGFVPTVEEWREATLAILDSVAGVAARKHGPAADDARGTRRVASGWRPCGKPQRLLVQ